jgi:invasion protein IalB
MTRFSNFAWRRWRFLGLALTAAAMAVLAPLHDAHAQQQRPPAAGPGRPPAPDQNPAVRDQAFQDWRMRCVRPAANQPEQCASFVEIILPESNQRLMNFTVIVVPGQPTPVATLTMPLGLYLPAGLQIAVDGQNPLGAPLTTCVPEGCQVSLNLDPGILPRMQNGKALNITFVENTAERRALTINASLAGFSQALAALRR